MGVPADSRMIEFAWRESEQRRFNLGVILTVNEEIEVDGEMKTRINDIQKYRHMVSITYECQDANREYIKHTSLSHETELFDEHDSIAAANARLDALLPGWIAADKLTLSGYGA